MSYMRKKKIEMDGASFEISSLTLDQVDAYVTPLEENPGETSEERLARYRARSFEMICDSLNNIEEAEAERQGRERDLWTKERVTKTFDNILLKKLNEEILDFSGLAVRDVPQGETGATESTSQKSDVQSPPAPAGASIE